jgi:GT2 family glycosyltransferase
LDLSIIIVNWNTKNYLRNCIQSISDFAGEVEYEIIVVDNDSSDGSSDMVQKEFPDVHLIKAPHNRGYAAGNNYGIKMARGRYALILNSDTLICDSALEKITNYADQHPDAAVIGCQVWENETTVQMTCFQFPSLLNLFLRTSGLARAFKYNHFFGRENMRWWNRDSEKEVDVVSGMFMLVRYDAIKQVGLMDEAFFLYFEETDWCYRFAKAGWKILFWPKAKIMHLEGGGKSGKTTSLKLRIQMQKSRLLFFRKHYGTIGYTLARILISTYAALQWLGIVLLITWKYFSRKTLSIESEKAQTQWQVFKYCVFNIEPDNY